MRDPLLVMTEHIKRLEEEVRKWKNIAGIMHEFIQEGDCKGAKQHYEEECAPWM
jgi:cob(I)alamin adenosyltransferase